MDHQLTDLHDESTPTVSPPSNTPSYWCYHCTRIVTLPRHDAVCPHCHGGFIHPADSSPPPQFNSSRRRNGTSFNPLIVLRTPPESNSPLTASAAAYELHYDDGSGTGLRPLPSSMSESLLGSGFELMLDRLSQIGFSLWSRSENPPASKKVVASLPTIEILPCHVDSDSHCAVCTEAFTIGSEAREMPCKHIYHSDCIFTWLNLHNSCPVCRHELPSDDVDGEAAVGLTIWRLPGGGFAVGRFVGGGEMPGVYSEMEGSLGLNGGGSSGIEWGPLMRRRRRGGGFRGFFGNLGSIFRRGRSDRGPMRSVSVSGPGPGAGPGAGYSILNRFVSRRNRSRD